VTISSSIIACPEGHSPGSTGLFVGRFVGREVGWDEGLFDGREVGWDEGLCDGRFDGRELNWDEGLFDELFDGREELGWDTGLLVGTVGVSGLPPPHAQHAIFAVTPLFA